MPSTVVSTLDFDASRTKLIATAVGRANTARIRPYSTSVAPRSARRARRGRVGRSGPPPARARRVESECLSSLKLFAIYLRSAVLCTYSIGQKTYSTCMDQPLGLCPQVASDGHTRADRTSDGSDGQHHYHGEYQVPRLPGDVIEQVKTPLVDEVPVPKDVK